MKRPRARAAIGLCLAGALSWAAHSTSAAQQVFRGRVDLVRVDVSVIDNRTSKPVTDLKAEDFTVTENGTRQRIDAFAFHGDVDGPGAAVRPATEGATQLAPHSRRVFMIVFGAPTGGLSFDGPFKVFDGTLRFLRERLRPGDFVSIMAFNRFTELTTDRDAAIRLVQRLKASHAEEYYQKRLATPLRGLRADLNATRQASIDRLMAPPGDSLKLRSATDLILNSGAFLQSKAWRPWNNHVIDSDTLKVHAAIEYLRRVEGNKQLVVFTHRLPIARPRLMPRMGVLMEKGEEVKFAIAAADAGVSINIVNVSGLLYSFSLSGQSFGLGGTSEIQTMQTAAEVSGGHYTGVRTATEQLDRIDLATRSGYALGYTSTNPVLDGRIREIKVTVNRPDVTVVYRQGYTARADPAPVDLRDTLTAQRFQQAMATDLELADIPIQAEAAEVEGSDGKEARVTIRIDGSKLDLQKQGDRWVGEVDLIVLCGDRDQKPTARLQQRMMLGMDGAHYAQAMTSGIPYSTTIPVSDRSVTAKVMVYEYETDRMGSVSVRIKGAR